MEELPLAPKTVVPLIQPPKSRRWKLTVAIILFIPCSIILIAYMLYCMVMYNVQDLMTFPTFATVKIKVAAPPEGTEILYRATDTANPDIKTEAWYLPAPQASTAHPAPLVVFFHGNAEIIDQEIPVVSALHEMGWSVLLPEYRSYNRSGGEPTQDNLRDDASYFLQLVLAKPQVDSKHVVFAGRSLGGAVAADLVNAHKPNGLILVTTFASMREMARPYHVPDFIIKNPFHTDDIVKNFDGPVLICHGNHDHTINVAQSHILAKLAQHGTYVEFDSDHNDFPGDKAAQDQYRNSVATFLADILAKK